MTIPAEINKLITTSGNNFHAKVARWFSDAGWYVTVSPYYMDQSQNKAREIDLIVEKTYAITDHFNRPAGCIAIRLFVECKFIAAHAVFWFSEKDIESVKSLVHSTRAFKENNTYSQKHHYLNSCPEVAKVFSSNNSGSVENEPFYKALNQVLSAMISLKNQNVSALANLDRYNKPKLTIEFPVVVCSSFEKLYGVDFYKDSEPEKIKEHFQLEVQYAYVDRSDKHRNELFIIDFVDFNSLKEFIDKIDENGNVAAYLTSTT